MGLRTISKQELARLAMETQRIVEAIQGMPLGRQIKGFNFGLRESTVEKGSFDSVLIHIEGRPTDQHLALFDRLLALFPDEVEKDSRIGERFGLRYTAKVRSKSAVIEIRKVGLRLIDQVEPLHYLYSDKTFSPVFVHNRTSVAVVFAKEPDRLWLISTQTPLERLSWGEGVISEDFSRIDSFLPFQPGIKLDDFDTLWNTWRGRLDVVALKSHPAIQAVANLSDGVIQKGRWALPSALEAAFIYQQPVRSALQPVLSKAGIALSKDIWLREEASEGKAYKLRYQSLNSSVVPMEKCSLERVIAVTCVRWDEIESWHGHTEGESENIIKNS